jgi:hypothetical protein
VQRRERGWVGRRGYGRTPDSGHQRPGARAVRFATRPACCITPAACPPRSAASPCSRSSRSGPVRRPRRAALDFTYYRSGESSVDGGSNSDLQSNTRAKATLALPLSRRYSLKLYASHGVSVRVGGRHDTLGAALQVRWGGGL